MSLSLKSEGGFTWSKIITTIIGSGSMVFFLTVIYDDFYNQPLIVLKAPRVEPITDGVVTTFTLKNEGRAPAHDVRLTINTEERIIDYGVAFNDEQIFLEVPSSRSIVGSISRLSENAEVGIFAAVNATEKDSLYKVSITFDEGSAKYVYQISDPVLEAEQAVSYSLIAAAASLLVATISFLFSLKRNPFGTLRTDKKEYDETDTIKVYGRVRRIKQPSLLLIRVENTEGKTVVLDQVKVADDGKFEYKFKADRLLTEGDGLVTATYRLVTATTSFKVIK